MITFEEVINHFGGSHKALADALGISREAVSMWGGEIPESRAFQIEVLSGGRFKATDLPVRRKHTAA